MTANRCMSWHGNSSIPTARIPSPPRATRNSTACSGCRRRNNEPATSCSSTPPTSPRSSAARTAWRTSGEYRHDAMTTENSGARTIWRLAQIQLGKRSRPHRNHVWSYDFLVDRTEDGRQLKLLVVIDEFTRECLAAEVGRTFTARDVMLTLQYLFAVRGAPEHVRSDNARGARSGVHRERVAALVGTCGRPHALHPESKSLGKWLCREF